MLPPIRSRGGCITCRRRRKKCDERLPSCERCAKSGIQCAGYDPTRHIVRDYQACQSVDVSTLASSPKAETSVTQVGSPSHPFSLDNQQQCSTLEIVQKTPTETTVPVPNILPIGRIFSSNFHNNLLEFYAAFFFTVPWKWSGPDMDIPAIVHAKARGSGAVRNAMLSLAALYQSTGNRSSAAASWRKQAVLYNQSARALFSQEVRRSDVPAALKLCAIVEVLLYEMKANPRRCQFCRPLMEQSLPAVIQVNGTNLINLADFRGLQSVEISGFAWGDIFTSFMLCKPTLLSYEHRVIETPEDNPTQAKVELEWIVCCPNPITYAFACITNLHSFSSQLSTSEIQEDARRIEEVIAAWRAPMKPTRAEQLILCAQECWRFTALICLYRHIHNVGALHPVIQDAVRQIVSLGRIIPFDDRAGSYLSAPLFIAGTVAVSPKEQSFIRERLQKFSSPPVVAYLHILEDVWGLMDRTGLPIRWGDILAKWQI